MNVDTVSREISVELRLEHEERLLLRKAASADYIEAPFRDFKSEYSPEDLTALSKMLKDANRIGVFESGDERSIAGKIAIELGELANELNYPTRFQQ